MKHKKIALLGFLAATVFFIVGCDPPYCGEWKVEGNAKGGTTLRIKPAQSVKDGSWSCVQVVIVEMDLPIMVQWVGEFNAPTQSVNGFDIAGDCEPHEDVAGIKKTYPKHRVEVHIDADGKTGTVMLHEDHFKMKR